MAPTELETRDGDREELVAHEASLGSDAASGEGSLGDSAFAFIPNDGDPGFGFKLNPEKLDAATNERLRAHATQAPWAHVFTARALYAWFERLNAGFFDGILSPPAIAVERLRKGVLGRYHPGRDGLGLSCHITISEALVASVTKSSSQPVGDDRADGRGISAGPSDAGQGDPSARVIAVLAHEMIHAWEDAVSGYGTGSWYHGDAFQAQARRIGIPTTKKGEYLGVEPSSRLAALLNEHGIPFSDDVFAALTPRHDSGSRSRLAKWTCGCTIVRASSGVNVSARCCKCHRSFMREDAAPPAGPRKAGSPKPARGNRATGQPSGDGAVVIPFPSSRTSPHETEESDG